MRLDTTQQMRTEMRLRMAPRMIQSMEILQLPIMALQERIEQELSENPVLEIPASRRRRRPTARRRRRQPAEPEADAEPNEFDSLINLDENWSEIYDEGPRRSRAALSEESDRKQDAMQNMASRPRSFHDDLIDQLSFFDCDPKVRALAEYIIYNLDEKGYFRLPLHDVVRDLNGSGDDGAGRGGAPTGPAARPAGRRRPRPARMPAAATHAGHAVLRRALYPDLAASRRPRAQPVAGHREEDRDPHRKDQGGHRAPAPAEFPPGGLVRDRQLALCRPGPDRRAQRSRRVRRPAGRREYAAAGDLALLSEDAAEQADRLPRPANTSRSGSSRPAG